MKTQAMSHDEVESYVQVLGRISGPYTSNTSLTEMGPVTGMAS